MEENQKTIPLSERKYELRLNSYKIAGAFGLAAVHNEVAIYDDKGKFISAFNGEAFDTKTGHGATFATGPTASLRVFYSEEPFKSPEKNELHHSIVIADNLSYDDILKKTNQAAAAGMHINDSKIEYVIFGGINHAAQNSNSVATSILRAMGYDYPKNELPNTWAPGSERDLLPTNWKSDTDEITAAENLHKLPPLQVAIQVKNDRLSFFNPNSSDGTHFPNFYDPNKQDNTRFAASFGSTEGAAVETQANLSKNFKTASLDQQQAATANTGLAHQDIKSKPLSFGG